MRVIVSAILGVLALAAPSASTAEPAPIVVYFGGPSSPTQRIHPASQQSQGLVIDFLIRNEPNKIVDRRRQLAEASALDYPLELMFSLRCVGLDATAADCRRIHLVGPGQPAGHVNQFFPRNRDGLGAIVVDIEPYFFKGRYYVSSMISFIDRTKQPSEGTKVILLTESDRAPSGLRGSPLYGWKTSRAPSEKEQTRLKPVRDYWMTGEPSRIDETMLLHLSRVATTLEVFLTSDGAGDPAPQFDQWLTTLPTGKELFKKNGNKCPGSCKMRYAEVGDRQYLGIKQNGGFGPDYSVQVF